MKKSLNKRQGSILLIYLFVFIIICVMVTTYQAYQKDSVVKDSWIKKSEEYLQKIDTSLYDENASD